VSHVVRAHRRMPRSGRRHPELRRQVERPAGRRSPLRSRSHVARVGAAFFRRRVTDVEWAPLARYTATVRHLSALASGFVLVAAGCVDLTPPAVVDAGRDRGGDHPTTNPDADPDADVPLDAEVDGMVD